MPVRETKWMPHGRCDRLESGHTMWELSTGSVGKLSTTSQSQPAPSPCLKGFGGEKESWKDPMSQITFSVLRNFELNFPAWKTRCGLAAPTDLIGSFCL